VPQERQPWDALRIPISTTMPNHRSSGAERDRCEHLDPLLSVPGIRHDVPNDSAERDLILRIVPISRTSEVQRNPIPLSRHANRASLNDMMLISKVDYERCSFFLPAVLECGAYSVSQLTGCQCWTAIAESVLISI